MVRGDTLNGIVEATAREKNHRKRIDNNYNYYVSSQDNQATSKISVPPPLNKYPTPLPLNFVRSKQMTRKRLFSQIKFETIASRTAM